MADDSSPTPPAPISAQRWSRRLPRPPAPRDKSRPYRFALRLIGVPAAAVAGVLIYRGLHDHLVLPECDSDRAKHTLTDVLAEMGLVPGRFEPLKTVSNSQDRIVC